MAHFPDVVDVAVGVLVERHTQDTDAALAMLTAWSESDASDLAEIAAGVVRSAEPRPQPELPSAVRRALDFIDAHAREDIGVDDIAAAARLGVRGLQQALHHHCDISPMSRLRQARLEGARRDLRTADPTRGDTVVAVANRWGFTNPGRFAGLYRRRYGVPPRHTLHVEDDPEETPPAHSR